MQPLFWLEEGELAGSRGPAGQNWDLDELQRSGIGAILSLAENVAADWPQSPFEFACIPLPSGETPLDADLRLCVEQLPKALDFIKRQRAAGLGVLVHCESGQNRTCLLLAYYLMEHGVAPLHAVARIRAVADAAFESHGWDQFVLDVLYALQE
ncbi:dual specificity protein phosphatase family protein [Shewanella algae]|uniref:dual specificity protein phosphatase family protein n=1 Tax=Shewanella algae TaxID=38313 RepID=UPI001BEF9C08|nr:dual specificity protein phosphatase family protein [Shewanella algae]BCV54529.1 protein phosphatase [Shewanella algae]